jgi:hypothetical protein
MPVPIDIYTDILKKIKDLNKDIELKRKQDASYLNGAVETLKLNYKCDFNGQDNTCPDKQKSQKKDKVTKNAWNTGMKPMGDNWYSIRDDREEKQLNGRLVTINKIERFQDGKRQDYWSVEPNPGGKGTGSFEHGVESTFKSKEDARKQANRYLAGELKALDYYEKKAERDITDLGLDPKKVKELSDYTDKVWSENKIKGTELEVSLSHYKNQGFLEIKKNLNEGKLPDEIKQDVQNIDRAINASVLPMDIVVYHGADEPDKELPRVGDIITKPSYVS